MPEFERSALMRGYLVLARTTLSLSDGRVYIPICLRNALGGFTRRVLVPSHVFLTIRAYAAANRQLIFITIRARRMNIASGKACVPT